MFSRKVKRIVISLGGAIGVAGVLTFVPIGRYSAVERAELLAHEQLIATMGQHSKSNFVTDGCSGGISAVWSEISGQFPELTQHIGAKPPWQDCCVSHDAIYDRAGDAKTAEESFQRRKQADELFQICVMSKGESLSVLEKDAFEAVSHLMYGAVRAGGAPCSGLPWRWGYGYPNCGL